MNTSNAKACHVHYVSDTCPAVVLYRVCVGVSVSVQHNFNYRRTQVPFTCK